MSVKTPLPHAISAIVTILVLFSAATATVNAYSSTGSLLFSSRSRCNKSCRSQFDVMLWETLGSDEIMGSSSVKSGFDAILLNRYACTRFERYDGNSTTTDSPSPSNPEVVKEAMECLDLARRAPSGFNAQPYKLVLVNTPEQKRALSRYCVGHNAHRVRDSDCTAVFLADRETARTMGAYRYFLISNNPKWKDRKWGLRKLQAVITLFSSGYPLPRFLAVPISFGVRLAMSCLSVITGRRLVLPSLGSAETWSTKNTMLVAMAYMLGCTSRGLATCPMEGYNAGGVRKALKIPRRYSVPLIVSTGIPYVRPEGAAATEPDSSDDIGITHGSPAKGSENSTPRYPVDDILYQDAFGNIASITQ